MIGKFTKIKTAKISYRIFTKINKIYNKYNFLTKMSIFSTNFDFLTNFDLYSINYTVYFIPEFYLPAKDSYCRNVACYY